MSAGRRTAAEGRAGGAGVRGAKGGGRARTRGTAAAVGPAWARAVAWTAGAALAAALALSVGAEVDDEAAALAPSIGPEGEAEAAPLLPSIGAEGDTEAAPTARDAGGTPVASFQQSAPYDGRYVFTRVRYGSGGLGRWGRGRGAWAHDYPDADLNLQAILEELTAVRPAGGTNILDLEDPEIFRHPILYMAEPGFWRVTEEGAANLRSHLLKGGLIIFDDFEAGQWFNFEEQVRRVLPGRELVEIGPSHPVFDSFFFVEDIYVPHPLVPVTPRYFGVFEDDDAGGRMMMLVNYNSDLAEYWEWSATGQFGVDPTNDAYRLGVNYIVYALTH